MPRLLSILPCETAIVSNDNKLSLVSLIESITIGLPTTQALPPNAQIPMRWFGVCVWEKTAADADKEYETYMELGHIKSLPTKMKMTTPLHRMIGNLFGFPVVFGEVRLKTYIREVPNGTWAEAGYFPIMVQRGGGLPQ